MPKNATKTDALASNRHTRRVIDLSHTIAAERVTCPGLPVTRSFSPFAWGTLLVGTAFLTGFVLFRLAVLALGACGGCAAEGEATSHREARRGPCPPQVMTENDFERMIWAPLP